jgi:Leucine-rich repeat (LRR) protein
LPTDFFASSLPSLLYLEAAACSLTGLPADMAAILPNLKVLNLNYNYFTSLEGLSNMENLRKLTVVGCRLGGREKGVVKCLKGLSSLEELDLRYVHLNCFG